MAQSFNPTASPNGPVSRAGETGGSGAAKAPQGSPKTPSGVQQLDGTNNIQAGAQVKQAALPSGPGGGKNMKPAGVQSFPGTGV